ncbi:MAG: fimbrillin family protein [Bacteroidales bacterium]|nr:fimbrillin family protein [Bacteroidales bacterium]
MKRSMILAGMALLTLAACNKTPETGPQPVDFSRYGIRVEPVITRATETDFEKGDAIGLSVVRAAGEYAANAKLTYDGTAFSGDLNWYDDGTDEATLKAYYPYTEGEALPTRFTVQQDQSKGTASSDFISAVKEGVLPSANAVAVVFKHQLSRLVVTLKNNSGNPVESVRFEEIVPVAVIADDLTATVAEGAKWQPITAFADGDKYYAIVPGQKVAPRVVVTSGGKELSQMLAETTLLPGKQYSVSVIVNKEEIKVVLAGEIENWNDGGEITGGGPSTEEHLSEGYILYGGDKYTVKQLSNKRWIMTQSLRYIPEGKTVSSDPADGNGLWYPYTSDGTTATPATDAASIEARGLLYDHQVAFGAEITADNFKTFEGTRGICPEGWHIPTQAEFLAIVGASNKTDEAAAATDESAVYYDAEYKAARIKTMNADGFNWDFAGGIMRNNNTATGKYQATVTKSSTCAVEEWVGRNAITYYMGSTGYTPANTETNRQFLSLMSTFTSTYNEGKVNVAYSNYLSGNPLRCIRDAE